MRVTTCAQFDIESGRELARESYEYAGPVAFAKGNTAKSMALHNAGTGEDLSKSLASQSQSIQSQMLPFLQSEMLNPTGFGEPALNEMKTQAGEAASGAAGTAGQRARLLAGRTGNTAGQNAVIADANRTGGENLIGADTNIDLANQQLKQQQQQEGVSGEGSLESGDLSGALNALGISNSGIDAWSGANSSAGSIWKNALLPMIQGGESAVGTYLGMKSQGAKPGCWLAAAVYDGWDDPRTIAVRDWLFDKWAKTFVGWIVTRIYLLLGERVAQQVEKRAWLRKLAKRVLDIALREAEADAALSAALASIRRERIARMRSNARIARPRARRIQEEEEPEPVHR